MFVFPHETDELESIDVGHIDVGDDEIVVSTWKKPHRVEATGRLDDLDIIRRCVEQLGHPLEGGANERPDRGGVLDDQDASHGCAA